MDIKIMTIGARKSRNTGKASPRLRISALWLNKIGFEYGALVSVEYSYGKIVLRLQAKGEAYIDIVKDLIKSELGLAQVSRETKDKRTIVCLQILDSRLELYGFKIGTVIAVQYEYGLITIKALDIEKLVF